MFLKICRAANIRLCNFGPHWANIVPKEIFSKKSLAPLLSVYYASSCHKTSKRSSASDHEIQECIILSQIRPKLTLPPNRFFLRKLTLPCYNYCTPSYYISNFLESESWDIIAWDIWLHNFGPNWRKNAQLCKTGFLKKTDRSYLCQSVVPYHAKMFPRDLWYIIYKVE